jgi:ABC-type branched-subunit amino acid transport system ATPase component
MTMQDNVLELRSVRKTFGGVVANDEITVDVPRGAIVGLIGPNGSGKTTLFNSIVGAHPIDGGSVRFDGLELSRFGVAQIARLGLLRTFQQAHVYDGLTCLQAMQVSVSHTDEAVSAMFLKYPAEIEDRALGLLDFVGLGEQRDFLAGNLSYGQRKLLEFAMALMNQPRMLLLDEPTAGVNPTLINSVIERLRRANRVLGITLLIIEHNMRVVMDLAEHIHCLAHGKLLASGTPDEIRSDPRVIEAYLGAR